MIAVTCISSSAGTSVPAGVAVLPYVLLNVDAVPMQWMQCPTRQMQYVVTEDAVPMKVDEVILQLLQCPLHVP